MSASGAISVAEERFYIASQQQLIWRRFKRHRLALISGAILIIMYVLAFTYEFWTPYREVTQHQGFVNTPPTPIHFFDAEGNFIGPFVYGLDYELNLDTFERIYTENTAAIHRIRFFHARRALPLLGTV